MELVVASVLGIDVLALPQPLVVMLLVTMGHAHFLHAYWFKWRAKKIDADVILKIFVGGTVCWLMAALSDDAVYMFGIILFTLHGYIDTSFVLGEKRSTSRDFSCAALIVAIFLIHFRASPWAVLFITSIALMAGLIPKRNATALFMSAPYFIASMINAFSHESIAPIVIFSSSIIAHYILWLTHIMIRGRALYFLVEHGLLWAFFVALYYLKVPSSMRTVIDHTIFTTNAFIFWTSLHIFACFRPRWIAYNPEIEISGHLRPR